MEKTSKILQITWKNGNKEGKYIFKNKFTPSGYCCEYKDYYEVALYSSYMRVNKKTLQVTTNSKDINKFEINNDIKVEIMTE